MAEKTIRHGVFTYHSPEKQVINGKEETVLVEHMAFHNQTVDIPRAADIERGERLNAFWTVPEALAHYASIDQPAPGLSGQSLPAPAPGGEADEVEEVDLADLDDEELVDWIMSTGRFDGQSKPTVGEVVGAADGDAEFAERLLAAEKLATNDATRQGVEEGLNKIIKAE